MLKTDHHRAKTQLTALTGGRTELVTFVATQEHISVNSLIAPAYKKRVEFSIPTQMQFLGKNWSLFEFPCTKIVRFWTKLVVF